MKNQTPGLYIFFLTPRSITEQTVTRESFVLPYKNICRLSFLYTVFHKANSAKQPSQNNSVTGGMTRLIKMKTGFIVLVFAAFFFASCRKNVTPPVVNVERTIRFVLYTEKDFSNENGNIIFSVVIRKDNRQIFDSSFSLMKVKDIPTLANRIVYEKKILVDENAKLTAGFLYTLENIGYSWYIEVCEPGERFKEINYSFQ
jgi:hypothetical protein